MTSAPGSSGDKYIPPPIPDSTPPIAVPPTTTPPSAKIYPEMSTEEKIQAVIRILEAAHILDPTSLTNQKHQIHASSAPSSSTVDPSLFDDTLSSDDTRSTSTAPSSSATSSSSLISSFSSSRTSSSSSLTSSSSSSLSDDYPDYYSDGSYEVSLSKNPPLPLPGANDPREAGTAARVVEFIRAHVDPAEQETMLHVMESLVYVPFDEFMLALDSVVTDLNQSLNNEPYVVLVAVGNSSKWMVELVYDKLQRKPEAAVDIDSLGKCLKDPGKSHLRHVVLIDDAAYSGEQMCRKLKTQIDCFAAAGISDFHIHVAIPFATQFAQDKFIALQNEPSMLRQGGTLHLMIKHTMPRAVDQIDVRHIRMLNSMYFPLRRYEPVVAFLMALEIPEFEAQLKLASGTIPEYDEILNHQIFKDLIKTPIGDPVDLAHFLKDARSKDTAGFEALLKKCAVVNDVISFLLKRPLEDWKGVADADDIVRLREAYDVLFSDKGLESRTLTIFPFKVPDQMSTLPSFQYGGIFHNGRVVKVQAPKYGIHVIMTDKAVEMFVKPPYKKPYS